MPSMPVELGPMAGPTLYTESIICACSRKALCAPGRAAVLHGLSTCLALLKPRTLWPDEYAVIKAGYKSPRSPLYRFRPVVARVPPYMGISTHRPRATILSYCWSSTILCDWCFRTFSYSRSSIKLNIPFQLTDHSAISRFTLAFITQFVQSQSIHTEASCLSCVYGVPPPRVH